MNLYEILEIESTASVAEIRAAYRRLVRSRHPDAGGTEEQFKTLKLAADVLSDPERRAHYDATGDTGEDPDSIDAQVPFVIEALLDLLLTTEGAEQLNLVEAMTASCVDGINTFNGKIRKAKRGQAKVRKMKDRFEKKKVNTHDLIGVVLDGKLTAANIEISKMEQHVLVLKKAKEVIATYNFVPDPDTPPPQSRPVNAFFTFNMKA